MPREWVLGVCTFFAEQAGVETAVLLTGFPHLVSLTLFLFSGVAGQCGKRRLSFGAVVGPAECRHSCLQWHRRRCQQPIRNPYPQTIGTTLAALSGAVLGRRALALALARALAWGYSVAENRHTFCPPF